MNKIYLKKIIFIFLLSPSVVLADVPSWKIIPKESSLTFTATQNGAPVTGTFTNFIGDINFDPAQLDKSKVKIVVNVGSISDPYNMLSDTLKTADWFNTKTFPQAIFQSSKFIKTGDNAYQANGTLTIRDKTQPIVLNFTQQQNSQTNAKVIGSTTIKRTAFGVGQGEWSDTKAIKDEVKINFTVTETRK